MRNLSERKFDPQKIWTSPQLPTLPTVAARLLDLSRNPETEIKDVIKAIKSDPATSAKILKSANSSYFGFKSAVTSVDRAVQLLGATVSTSLALSFSILESAMTTGPLAEHFSDYWMQSIVQAAAAEILSETNPDSEASEYFLAGLLIDIGRLAMLKTISKHYLPALTESRDAQRELYLVENDVLGFNHVEVGMKLMEHWKLPASLIQVIGAHHLPPARLATLADQPDFHLKKSIAVASSVGDYFCCSYKGKALERLKAIAAAHFQWSDADVAAFLERAKVRIDAAGDLFNVNTESLGSSADLMAEASEQLACLAMREHVASTQASVRQEVVERENQELESQNRTLQKMALVDPLTRIYNRQFFDESLAMEISRASRTAATVGLLFTDIDKFKTLNDTYGHQFGDHVLQRIAAVMQQALRKSDILARYGGEEFVICISQPTEKGIEKVAERLRAAIEAENICFEGRRVPVTTSVGVSMVIPNRRPEGAAEQLIAAADAAMYEAKQNGRNQVRVRSLLSDLERRLAANSTLQRYSRWLVARKAVDIVDISKVLLQTETVHVPFGVLAQKRDLLTAEQIDHIQQDQHLHGERFGVTAIRLGLLTEDQVARVLALQQEDPLELNAMLIRQGLLPAAQAGTLLEEYLVQSFRPQAAAAATTR